MDLDEPPTLAAYPPSCGGAGPPSPVRHPAGPWPGAQGRLSVVVADGGGRRLRAPGLASWLRRVAPVAARGTVSIALVGDARVRALNRTYCRKDYATDVLSFPTSDAVGPGRDRASRNRRRPLAAQSFRPAPFLGEIVIARGVARRQARDARHSELTEHRVLALHGLLHLLGYDHERDNGRMRRVERRLRRKGGLREGLIERGSASAPAPVKKRQRLPVQA
jgi:probable rRNA maturation factor